MWDKEWKAIGARLQLTDKQQQGIAKIRDEFGKKFHELAKQGETNMPEKARELKGEFFTAIRSELNDKQRSELPAVMHEEFGQWAKPEVRQQHLKDLGQRLNLTDAQKQQIEGIHTQFDSKIQAPMDQLKKLHQEEFDAMGKVLTADQRTKLHDLLQAGKPAQPGAREQK
jgi:BMFP domain-containing protein YqiC